MKLIKLIPVFFASLLFAGLPPQSRGDDFAARCLDRAGVERVYHAHRLGTKQPFAEAMPQTLLERIVRRDQQKETVLRNFYATVITEAMVTAEVERIETTTQAPEVLAEIKSALGNDPGRFAQAMARPIVVERELRQRFDNDNQLHAAQRREAERARELLLAGQPVAKLYEVTWQLTPRPGENKEEGNSGGSTPDSTTTPTKGSAKSNSYTNESTARIAQPLTPPASLAEGKGKMYFEDLDEELQSVLRADLQKPGDISPVIERPSGFLLFLAKEKSPMALTVASLSIPKRSYEEWLASGTKNTP